MSDPRFNTALADKLVALYRSDLWVIIKNRLNAHINVLETRALRELLNSNATAAGKYVNRSEGIKGAIDVVERIPSDFIKDKLNADVLLGVIEKKPKKQEEGISCLKRLKKLVKFRKK